MASNLGTQTFTLTLPSADLSGYPTPKDQRRISWNAQIQPLPIEEGQAWNVNMASIEFYHPGTAIPVFVNINLIEGARVGSNQTNTLYRIPLSVAPTSAGMFYFTPAEFPPLYQPADPNAGSIRNVEVSLTDAQGNLLPTPPTGANEFDTTLILTFTRVA